MSAFTDPDVWSHDAAAAFERTLEQRTVGADPRRLGDPGALGRRAALLAVAGRLWTDQLGPFYDTNGVRSLLGDVTRQAVADRTRRGVLLALRTGAGQVVYPAFQFGPHGQVIAGLAQVLSLFYLDDTSSWTVASWLVTPDPDLAARSPVDALRDGDLDAVLAAAHDVVAGFAA
jgi:hypothetical protein